MPVLVGDLLVKLALENQQYKDELEKTRQQTEKGTTSMADATAFLGKAWNAVAPIAVAGLTAIAGAMTYAIGEAAAAQEAQTQLNAVIASTGGVAGVSADEALGYASSLQEVTRFSDESIVATESMLLTFTSIGEDVFPQATETALDMATALGQDATQAAVMLGKALNNPVEGVTALQRVGVQLTDAQKDQVAAFMEVNDIASAQGVILKELAVEFGGSARAAGTTFAGQLDIAQNALSDVAETWGGALLPIVQEFAGEALPILMDSLDVMTSQHLPAFVELIGKTADGLLTAFDAGMLLLTWSDRIDMAMADQNQNLVVTTSSYEEYQAGMRAAAEAIGEQVIFTDQLTDAQAETIDAVIGLTEEEYIQEKQVSALEAIYAAAGVTTYAWADSQEAAADATATTTETQIELGLAIAGVAESIDFEKQSSTLLNDVLEQQGLKTSEVNAFKLQFLLITGEITKAEYDDLVAKNLIIQRLENLNSALDGNIITQEQWLEILKDGIVTVQELGRAMTQTWSPTLDASIDASNQEFADMYDVMGDVYYKTNQTTEAFVPFAQAALDAGMPLTTLAGATALASQKIGEAEQNAADFRDRLGEVAGDYAINIHVTVSGDAIPNVSGGGGGGTSVDDNKNDGNHGFGLVADPGIGEPTAMPGMNAPALSYDEMLQAIMGTYGVDQKRAASILAEMGYLPGSDGAAKTRNGTDTGKPKGIDDIPNMPMPTGGGSGAGTGFGGFWGGSALAAGGDSRPPIQIYGDIYVTADDPAAFMEQLYALQR